MPGTLVIKRKNIKVSSKINRIDLSILTLMFLQLTILEFFGIGSALNKICSIIIIVRLLYLYGFNLIQKKSVALFGIVICFFLLSGLFSIRSIENNFKDNFLLTLYPMIYGLYVCVIYATDSKYILNFIIHLKIHNLILELVN